MMDKKEAEKGKDIKRINETLSPNERKILPCLQEGTLEKIGKKAELDLTSALRALEFLKNKGLVELDKKEKEIVDLDVNGILYRKKGLPERALLHLIAEKNTISLNEAKRQSKLSDNEFKASLGALKKKALISLSKGNLVLQASKDEVVKKSLEELFLEALPIDFQDLKPEQKFALESLKKRKKIVILEKKKEIEVKITELGKNLLSSNIKTEDMIERLTPEIIRTQSYKGKKFRRYDLNSQAPKIYGGKSHFVSQAMDYARKIWTELGFEEMPGTFIQTGFWNFDALFTAQDHPVREMHDTFYLKGIKGKLPDKSLVNEVKKAHEKGIGGSKGWNYSWSEEEPKKVILRTHTTCLSAHSLSKLRELKEKKGKFFAVGRVFRNETLDWSHGFEFNQTEGIVVDKNANFRHLLGYLKEFFKKMGFENIRFTPAYFPYTEPSVEINWFHPEKKVWLELGGAGMFRPELTIPLLREHIPVLAWGPGFDRIIMDYYQIKDLREMYENNLTKLREKKFWVK